MRKEIPEPNGKTTLIISNAMRTKADVIAATVEGKTGKRTSLAMIVHHLIEAADVKRVARELARKPACAECRKHYGDDGVCDQGKPVNSPHRRKRGARALAAGVGE